MRHEMQKYQNLPSEGFIRVGTLAAILGVAVVTVWRWSANGYLPKPLKLADRVTVWKAEEVRAWIQAHSETNKTPEV
jgi:prophage regulatory protein